MKNAPGDLERCEIIRAYSKSEYQLRIYQIGTDVLQQIIVQMAVSEAVGGTTIVDSSGFSVSRRIKWHNAKYGNISVKLFAKTHLIHTPQDSICIAMVTPGKANDSPCPRMMIKMLPVVQVSAGRRGV